MTATRPSIDTLSALHVVDCLARHELGISQARILLVMHLTGAKNPSEVKRKTKLERDHIRGVFCHLRMKEMVKQANSAAVPDYLLTPKAHAFLTELAR